MKKFFVSFICLCTLSCASGGGLTFDSAKIDWTKTSTYYHNYVAGLIAPIAGTAATVLAPSSAPLVAWLTKEVGQLDTLIAAKAAGEDISKQAERVQGIIVDIGNMVVK